MSVDEETMLLDSLAAHRAMLMGARRAQSELDLEGALEVHAGIGNIMTRWTEFSAGEQREIVRTIEYLINDDDDHHDLTQPDGFADDKAELRRLQAFLGYV